MNVGAGLDGGWVRVVDGVGSFVSNGLVVEGVGVCDFSVFWIEFSWFSSEL